MEALRAWADSNSQFTGLDAGARGPIRGPQRRSSTPTDPREHSYSAVRQVPISLIKASDDDAVVEECIEELDELWIVTRRPPS